MFVSLLQINIIYSDVNKFQKVITVLEVKANLYALPPQREGKTDLSPKTNNQQVQWVFQRQNSPDTKLRIGHALLTKTLPSKCKVRGFNPLRPIG